MSQGIRGYIYIYIYIYRKRERERERERERRGKEAEMGEEGESWNAVRGKRWRRCKTRLEEEQDPEWNYGDAVRVVSLHITAHRAQGPRGRDPDHKWVCRGPGPPLGDPKSPRRATRQPSRRPKAAPGHPQDSLQPYPAAHEAFRTAPEASKTLRDPSNRSPKTAPTSSIVPFHS